MIKPANRFDNYTYRVSEYNVASSLLGSTLEAGTFVKVNSNHELIKATGASGEKAFIMTSSEVVGRDTLTGRATCKGNILMGAHILDTDQFDKTEGVTYAPGKALKVSANGILTPVTIAVYNAVTGETAPEWVANTYYSKSGNAYILTTEQPADWATTYTSYYTKSIVDGVDASIVKGTIVAYALSGVQSDGTIRVYILP